MTSEFWQKTATLADAISHGLTEEEFSHIKEVLGRDLSVLEVGITSALFSEHCSYKSTKVHLRNLPTKGERVIHGPGENAGVIDIGDNEAVVFKVESHNHPTFIEPFQGAATGVGGILRDVFTMGARPLGLMNALRFGAPTEKRTPYLLTRAVSGIGHYGNCMGIPTVGGELFFHPSYNGNCLVNAFALGLVKQDEIFLGQASGIGNSIMYVGSKTGRDGIHGATMSSSEFDENSAEKRPTVQVGDAFQEKLLLEACLEAMKSGAIVGIQDMGAAGMTSSTYEMADRAETGLRLDLDKIPQRETGMNPYEIMLSESQERMLVAVKKGEEQKILDIFDHWELDAVKIGEITEGNTVRLYWHGECVSEIQPALLTRAVPEYRWPEEEPQDFNEKTSFNASEAGLAEPKDLASAWLALLTSPNLCSRAQLYSQYDSTVRSNTVIHPGGDAAVIRIKKEDGGAQKVEKGIAMTLDCNSRYCAIDPRAGTALSVAESIRNLTAVGAEPIGISDCLNFGSPQKPQGMWQIAESIRGLGEAARAFNTPIVSGNVSLNNQTNGEAIYPTPMIAMVGLMKDASKAVTAHFKEAGDVVLVVGQTDGGDLGGSEYLAQQFGIEKGRLPRLDYNKEMATSKVIIDLINGGLLKSCHDVGTGGLAVSLAECCISQYGKIGATVTPVGYKGRSDGLLFAETGARYIVSCGSQVEGAVRKAIVDAGLEVSATGVVGGTAVEIAGYASLQIDKIYQGWKMGLDHLFLV